jgi:predicted TIM-barrel fold metal-dependent hydrolase
MTSKYVDIHPHIIADDFARYPRDPLFGVQSDWSRDRPVTIEQLVAAMDEAGVDKAAIVQASTCYGYDNSYVTDSVAKYPRRFTAVGSVDVMQPDAPQKIREWKKRGVSGLRLFTGGSTAAFDTSSLDDKRSFPVWDLLGQEGMSMCIQTAAVGLAQVAGLAKRFPGVNIILDHLSRPDISDGAPYVKAVSLFALAAFDNVYLKLTPRNFHEARLGKASPETFFPKLVSEFGASRLAWGSNYPSSEGKLTELLNAARSCLEVLPQSDREWIFAKTAQSLYPALADR